MNDTVGIVFTHPLCGLPLLPEHVVTGSVFKAYNMGAARARNQAKPSPHIGELTSRVAPPGDEDVALAGCDQQYFEYL